MENSFGPKLVLSNDRNSLFYLVSSFANYSNVCVALGALCIMVNCLVLQCLSARRRVEDYDSDVWGSESHHMLIVLSLFGKRDRHKISKKKREKEEGFRDQPLEKLQSLCCRHLVLLLLVFGNFPFLSDTHSLAAGCRTARISLRPCVCVYLRL